jgi:NADPH:quinone reductase-like Zn-dependent oxidoreductase
MKAAVYTRYGPPEVLQVKEVPRPIPKDNEMLVRVKATAVNSGDWRLRKADPFVMRLMFGVTRPRIPILGSVYSGEVEQTGKDVTQFKTGDVVFGHTDMHFGAYAEYICQPENGSLAIKPAGMSHEEAAVIPFGGVTALYFLRKANITPGQKVLVAGASGAVGTAALQLAKSFGAAVTGICSTANKDLVTSLGADHVIDYTREDVTKNGVTYDVIFDTVKALSVGRALASLTNKGTMLLSAAGLPQMLRGAWVSKTSHRKVVTGIIHHTAADIVFLQQLVEAGAFKPVIDRTYPLEQIAAAHAYVQMGHKKGNVAITV